MAPEREPGANGVRITNREIYDSVLDIKERVTDLKVLLAAEVERREGLAVQVKLLWTLSFALVTALVAAGVKVFTS